ncbi:hypothetical protein [Pedobacter nyackensis]|uniref:Uncharacterized protein n=1 Tax=Pedobacter nyackensis TaxID=475255 RepID=A0A1W2F537_9SPHI|nr:hypothetical protein [Pedobacter nyackensis]SMD17007.1 hypothetical protein SAMN04488101_12144 [Pedobacter nyackensis]
MENQLLKIGQYMLDLNLYKPIVLAYLGVDELKLEFKRVNDALTLEWVNKRNNLGYYLEFHQEEVVRLLGRFTPDDIGVSKQLNKEGKIRAILFNYLFYGLINLLSYLELLKEEKDIDLKLD